MAKLSLIIPYYKTLKETKELFKILEPQLTKDVEVLLIDDGCNEKELDKLKAKVIHLETPSGNASKPRNVGLDNATGEYICFIDSDDKISNDYIEKILNKINTSVFDYCYISWKWNQGEIIIENEPPSWNTCVWNCIYKKLLIGDNRFDINKNVAEDEDFNKRVRKGKKDTIKDILYYYNHGREGSLTNLASKGIISWNKTNDIKCGLLVYQKYVSKIGGIETFLNEFFEALYNDYDILFVYKEANEEQLLQYKRYVKCIKFNGQKFICDKYLCASNQDNIADNVTSLSGEYLDMIQADLKAMKWKYQSHPKTTKHIAVSELAKKGIEEQDDLPCDVIYNLYNKKEAKKPIKIMSANRMSIEKGKEAMEMFAKRLKERNIPYIWINFTDNTVGEENGILYHSAVYDIQNYFGGFDVFFSGSRTESYGYSIVQAMTYGLPIIVRDIPILDEIGFKDGMHGYKLDYDMNNIDEVIDKLDKLPKFTYNKLDDVKMWYNELGVLNKYNNYKEELNMKYLVEALDTYKNYNMIDSGLGFVPEAGFQWEVDKVRLDVLSGDNSKGLTFVKLVKEIKPEEKKDAIKEREIKKDNINEHKETDKREIPKKASNSNKSKQSKKK